MPHPVTIDYKNCHMKHVKRLEQFSNLSISIPIPVAGDMTGLIDDSVEGARGEGEEEGEESGEGEQGSGEEDSDDNVQKKEKRKRCKPFTFDIQRCLVLYPIYSCAHLGDRILLSYLIVFFVSSSDSF